MHAKELISQLQLIPHPEGGFYRETYRSDEMTTMPGGYVRNISTAIYYLLENKERSHFHRISSDELWFFHQGQSLMIMLLQDNDLKTIMLGNDMANGEVPQAMIPANTWFASGVKNETGFSLVSCTVAPGFDFSDFELARRKDLVDQFPHLAKIIEEFTFA